jgi:hypothetical protein
MTDSTEGYNQGKKEIQALLKKVKPTTTQDFIQIKHAMQKRLGEKHGTRNGVWRKGYMTATTDILFMYQDRLADSIVKNRGK